MTDLAIARTTHYFAVMLSFGKGKRDVDHSSGSIRVTLTAELPEYMQNLSFQLSWTSIPTKLVQDCVLKVFDHTMKEGGKKRLVFHARYPEESNNGIERLKVSKKLSGDSLKRMKSLMADQYETVNRVSEELRLRKLEQNRREIERMGGMLWTPCKERL